MVPGIGAQRHQLASAFAQTKKQRRQNGADVEPGRNRNPDNNRSSGGSDDKARRVIFNAITKTEIQKAFKNPMSIDMDRVNAQQARRILDRIVGYEISPLLWR